MTHGVHRPTSSVCCFIIGLEEGRVYVTASFDPSVCPFDGWITQEFMNGFK